MIHPVAPETRVASRIPANQQLQDEWPQISQINADNPIKSQDLNQSGL
jgi:hypothetical protein